MEPFVDGVALRRPRPPLDRAELADVLPRHVLDELARRRQRRDEQLAAGRRARRRRCLRVAGWTAAAYAAVGALFPGAGWVHGGLDALLGAAAGYRVVAAGGGAFRGLAWFGLAAGLALAAHGSLHLALLRDRFACGCLGFSTLVNSSLGVLTWSALLFAAFTAGWGLGAREATRSSP